MAGNTLENMDKSSFSPMMQKYLETKEKYKDCILFYRLGDFYEMFFDDAITASRELEITLTGKDCGQAERAPMAGIPHHAAEVYAAKLIEKGYKVAICEQLEDPKTAKGIVERGVIRILTPGTIVESNLLEEKKNNYIMCICKTGLYFGISVCDISTGEFYSSEIKGENNFETLLDEIARFSPSEIIANSMMFECQEEMDKIRERFSIYMSRFSDKFFSDEVGNLQLDYNILENKKEIGNLKEKTLVVKSINALLEYLNETQMTSLEHINTINIYNLSKYMALDINARSTSSISAAVSTTETSMNSVTVFPKQADMRFWSPAPTARPIDTVVPIASPTIMTVSMCMTWLPTETAVVDATPSYWPIINKSASP